MYDWFRIAVDSAGRIGEIFPFHVAGVVHDEDFNHRFLRVNHFSVDVIAFDVTRDVTCIGTDARKRFGFRIHFDEIVFASHRNRDPPSVRRRRVGSQKDFLGIVLRHGDAVVIVVRVGGDSELQRTDFADFEFQHVHLRLVGVGNDDFNLVFVDAQRTNGDVRHSVRVDTLLQRRSKIAGIDVGHFHDFILKNGTAVEVNTFFNILPVLLRTVNQYQKTEQEGENGPPKTPKVVWHIPLAAHIKRTGERNCHQCKQYYYSHS